MSKIKKVLAVVLAMAMVMAMSIVSLADTLTTITPPNAMITVKGIAIGDEVAVYKLVTLNEAGNEWVYNVDKNTYFTEAGGIISLVEAQKVNLKNAALTDSTAVWTSNGPVSANTVTTTALPVGAYLIKVTDPDGEIAYGTLVAETYKQDEKYLEAENKTVTAKPSSYTITKTSTNSTDNRVVRLGESVTFNIDTIFPSFGADTAAESRVFTITDDPTGMKITGIEVYIGGTDSSNKTTAYTLSKTLESLVADEDLVITFDTSDESKYGKTVRVVVTAEITSLSNIKNNASTNHSDQTPEVDQYTAQITLTKKNQDESEILNGAQFKVKKGNDYLYFTKDTDVTDGYTLSKEGTTGASDIITASEGSVTIKGLDEGTYHFEEITAPAGYSINEQGVDVTISSTDTVDAATGTIVSADNIMTDTKLASLPSTGGIGTTIFTVVGCLIMIAAAAMFFVSRRRTEK